tara:strand:- start:503 stop:901 length:399 start_codon:yes stop_codon:yes gene_type:complete
MTKGKEINILGWSSIMFLIPTIIAYKCRKRELFLIGLYISIFTIIYRCYFPKNKMWKNIDQFTATSGFLLFVVTCLEKCKKDYFKIYIGILLVVMSYGVSQLYNKSNNKPKVHCIFHIISILVMSYSVLYIE